MLPHPLLYVVQYRETNFNGTAGIHSRFVLFSCLFDIVQLESCIIYYALRYTIYLDIINRRLRYSRFNL